MKEARLLRFKGPPIAVGWNVWFPGGVSMTAGYRAIFPVDIVFAVLSLRDVRRMDSHLRLPGWKK